MAKAILMVAGGMLLLGASAGRSFGQLPQLGGPPACACASIPHEQEHFDGCCEKLCAWLTYQPIKKPGLSSCCCGCKCDGCCQPPLFTYFPCMGCGIAMRPCPTCDGMPAAHILSIQESAAKGQAQDPSARILNVEGDKFVVVDRTAKPLGAPAPSLANATGALEATPRILQIEGQGCTVIDRTAPQTSFQEPELTTTNAKAPSAHILDIQGQAAPQTEKDGPDLPFADR